MYGFAQPDQAEQKRVELSARYPELKFEVAKHKHAERSLWGREDKTETWGVKRYVPYVPQMPWRFDGFVWFTR